MAQKQGLVVFNSDGNPILEISDRLTKYSGEVDIIPQTPSNVAESGNVQCAELVAGMGLWYIITALHFPAIGEPILGQVETPYFTYHDGYFTWSYSGRRTKIGIRIIYGVY